jgi:hypothetical protein
MELGQLSGNRLLGPYQEETRNGRSKGIGRQ